MSSTSSKKEEPKLTLPAGHPNAGHLSADRSFTDGAGESSDEQKARDELVKEQQTEAEAVAEHEHKVATEEKKKAEETTAAETGNEPASATSSKRSSS